MVEHEHNGLLVDTDRGGKAFARAVARLAASPDLRFTPRRPRPAPRSPDRTWDDAVAELLDRALPRGRPAAPTEGVPGVGPGRRAFRHPCHARLPLEDPRALTHRARWRVHASGPPHPTVSATRSPFPR